jgi:hypothetical protein
MQTLSLLARQYFQLLEPDLLTWPDADLVKRPESQRWIFENLFTEIDGKQPLPPCTYQLRVLKRLMAIIEHTVVGEEDVCRLQFVPRDIPQSYSMLVINSFSLAAYH